MKPSKKTEWEKGVKFGIKKAHKTWMTRIKKMRTDYKFLLHQRDNEIREWVEKNKQEYHLSNGGVIWVDDLLTYLSNREEEV